MNTIGYLIILSLGLFSFSISYSTLGDLVITAWPLNDPLKEGEFPTIVGNVQDQGGNPVEDAKVKVAFATETVTTKTNNVGSFTITYEVPAQPGEYTINVISTKEGYGMDITSLSYFVNGIPQSSSQLSLTEIYKVPSLIEDGLTKNPLSQIILEHMENIQKQQEVEKKKWAEIEKHQNFIVEQRNNAQSALEEELKKFEKASEINAPRQAFGRFVESVDQTVQGIFWDQFYFTESKHNDAYLAKVKALEEGETSVSATKIFQRKAAVTKAEIIDYNEELNIKHGFADEKSQTYFDNEGKKRWDKDTSSE